MFTNSFSSFTVSSDSYTDEWSSPVKHQPSDIKYFCSRIRFIEFYQQKKNKIKRHEVTKWKVQKVLIKTTRSYQWLFSSSFYLRDLFNFSQLSSEPARKCIDKLFANRVSWVSDLNGMKSFRRFASVLLWIFSSTPKVQKAAIVHVS